MQDAKLSIDPAEPGLHLSKNTSECDSDVPYREAVGSLLFVARVCRPDIEFAVNQASQFVNIYNKNHWQAIKKIIHYLNGPHD